MAVEQRHQSGGFNPLLTRANAPKKLLGNAHLLEMPMIRRLASLSNRAIALSFSLALVGTTALPACGGPQPVRGEEVEGLDDEAFSTGLDRRDLEKMLNENMKVLQSSAIIQRWENEKSPTIAVLPLKNETSEHVDSALESRYSASP